ncbi:hypothetical protein GYMLUDRAFT_93035 [Collybiopsis luxurians FD-317 M1]|nr:hypothetical protein GYMLUDRAFT_93035 [Collybiopsis luxurians FD-317 M1]
MSSNSSPVAPRRSQRDKKQAKPITTFTEPSTTSRKRKHAETDDEGPPEINGHASVDEDEADEEDTEAAEDGDDEEERPKKSRKKTKGQSAKQVGTAASSTRKPKKPRPQKESAVTKPRKRAANAPNTLIDLAAFTKSTNISSDNPLFNAILNPNAALQGIVEDFLESLNQDENRALAELVNMIFRCCACNDSIDGDTAVDYDGVVDRLDDMTEELKKTTSPTGTYPLISKAAPFHSTKPKNSFRANLSDFISRLINSAALLGSLYDSPLTETLQVWLVPMSSSQLRAIRHTSTVVALEIEAALCQVAKEVEKEFELTGRMKEGEKKRARTKGAAGSNTKGKEKELDAKLKEIKKRQSKLEEYIRENIDSVFIHRFRDLDPIIRAECISSLSTFFEILPSHFCTNSDYFRYVGWVLSDAAGPVRLAAVKALQVVYEGAGAGNGAKRKDDGGGVVLPALRHFTTRFLPRMLEIARFDVDISVRVAVMNVLGCVAELALLPEEDRIQLGTLIFSDEPRVRKGVARFVAGVWEEWVEEKMDEIEIQPSTVNNNGRGRGRGRGKGGAGVGSGKGRTISANNVDQDKVGIKGFVHLLVQWGRALDRGRRNDSIIREEEEDSSQEREETIGDTETGVNDTRGIAPTLVTSSGKKAEISTRGRIGLAVEALWDEMDVVRDWEGVLDMLVLDHSASGENDSSNNKVRSARAAKKSAMKKRGPQSQANGGAGEPEESGNEEDDDDNTSTSTRVDQSWRLTEIEEGALLEILVSSLRRTRKDDNSTSESITQALIKALPRLFIKYQTDENRIIDVLTLPTLMNLEVYLEMRETNAYISLWSDVAKQFLTHTSSYVITTAVQTMISHLLANTALSNINSEQILELEDQLATSLRDTVAGPAPPPSSESESSVVARDIEICLLTEDEVITLTSVILRLRSLAQYRDLTSWMEESEGGKRSSAWDVLSAVSERARLSLDGEGEMLQQCIQLLTLHIMWKSKRLLSGVGADPLPEEVNDRDNLFSKRSALLEKLVEYAVGTQVQGNGIVEGVKRVAFKNLLDLHSLFMSIPNNSDSEVSINMDDEVQWRCAGFVQAEVMRYAEKYAADAISDPEDDDDPSDDGDNEDGSSEKGVSKKTKQAKQKAKAPENGAEDDFSSRPHLELEYLFIDVISTFLRAIRVGVIQVRHGDVLLAHYGRFGPAFDACSKVVVEVLKEEGFSDDNGQLIVLVITQSMKEAFDVFKKAGAKNEANLVALAKLLSSCFIIRGSQLAILRRLEAQHIVEIHTSLITWVIKQIGMHANSTKDQKIALSFFRALVPLVMTVQSRDALKIKAHMDQAWVHANIEPGTTKMWEPLRAYEKRLTTAMGKDKPSATRGSRKKKKDGGVSTDAEESEAEKLAEHDQGLSDENARTPPSRRSSRPRRAAAIRTLSGASSSDTEGDVELSNATPKSRRPPRAVYKSKGSKSPDKSIATSRLTNSSDPAVSTGKRLRADEDENEEEPDHTPLPSHKRPRHDDPEEISERREPLAEAEESASRPDGNDPSGPASPEEREERETTPAADIQIRRKRIRH